MPADDLDAIAGIVYDVAELDPFNLHAFPHCAFCGSTNPHMHNPRCLWKRAATLRWRSATFKERGA